MCDIQNNTKELLAKQNPYDLIYENKVGKA